jgi:hypothetical protein
LGEFSFEKAQGAKIVFTTADTEGHVIIDAVRLLTAEQFEQAKKDEPPGKSLVANSAKKDEKPEPPVEPPALVKRSPSRPVQRVTSHELDQMLEQSAGHVMDAPLVDDAWFLRRVAQDLVGRQPTLEELQQFQGDSSSDKRAHAVERLLASPEYGRNWANYWSDTIASRTPEPQLTFLNYDTFEEWLAAQFNEGRTWDEIVFRVITASGSVGDNPAGAFIGFHQGEANRIAGETTRVFLGVKIACAECHDHPFIDMPQEVFHGMAAFFVRVKAKLPWNDSNGIEITSDPKAEQKMPGAKEPIVPTLLDATAQAPGLPDLKRRQILADWLVSSDNPYFARAYVNRIWARLMGRGFYDPVDDMGEGNEPLLAEVHNALADHFVASGFDTREVFRLITLSRAYQRTLSMSAGTGDEAFVSSQTKRLRGDEVFDSLEAAIEIPNVTPPPEKASAAVRFPVPPKSTRDLVNEAFGYDPSFPDAWLSRTMNQAMFLMNNNQLHKQLDASPESGTVLARLLAAEPDDQKAIDILYQRVLARSPSQSERKIVTGHLKRVANRGEAFEDVLWSLLNTAEFTTRK